MGRCGYVSCCDYVTFSRVSVKLLFIILSCNAGVRQHDVLIFCVLHFSVSHSEANICFLRSCICLQ
jgi:hypothetical protein